MQPVEVRAVHNVVVEQGDLADAEPRQQHSHRAAGATAADDAYPQAGKIVVERRSEGERLTLKGRQARRKAAAGIVKGKARTGDADHAQRHVRACLRQQPDAARPLAVFGEDQAQHLRAFVVAVHGELHEVGLVRIVLRREGGHAGGVIVDDGDDLIVACGCAQRADEGRGAPGDEAGAGVEDLVVRDRNHLHGKEFLVRLAVPRIAPDGSTAAQYIGGVFKAVTAQQVVAQRRLVVFAQGEAERGHAALSSAFSTRLIIVQMPSMPGRHSLLWRDQRCQLWPAKLWATLAAFG